MFELWDETRGNMSKDRENILYKHAALRHHAALIKTTNIKMENTSKIPALKDLLVCESVRDNTWQSV